MQQNISKKCAIPNAKYFRAFSYEGEWVEGVKQGKGTYIFGNGDTFEGIYENNKRHGAGFLKKTDGEHREENWKEDKLVNFNVVKEKDKDKK